MLLSDKEHESVKNLTAKQVKSLDDCATKLKIDAYQWLYIGRSRKGDQTGHQIEATFYGKNLIAPRTSD